jgi:tetratricopeptide (TPR) repeat protein
LIHAKGSIQSRIEKVKHEEQILKEREQEIEEAKREYDDAKAGTIKEKEEIEDHCLTLKDRFMLELNVDSAAYYMEQLVNLDSTDVYYLAKVGSFYHEIYNFKKAEYYFKRALDICMQSVDDYAYEICGLKVNLADIYCYYKDYSKAEILHKETLETIRRAGGEIESKIKEEKIDEIVNQMGLAGFYMTSKQYSKADSLFLDIVESLKNGYYEYDDDETMQGQIADIYTYIGMNYYNQDKQDKGDSLLMEAINIYRELALIDSFYYEPLGIALSSFGFIKLTQEQYNESESLLLESLDIINKTTGEEKEINIAQNQAFLGKLYKNTQRPLESEKWYKEAVTVLRRYASAIPEKYNNMLCDPINDLAELYLDMGRIDESKVLFEEALKIDSLLALSGSLHYINILADSKLKLARINVIQKHYHEADSLYNGALIIMKQLAEDDHSYDYFVIETLEIIAALYFTMGDSLFKTHNYSESEIWQLKALEIVSQLYKNNPDKYEPDLTVTIEHIAVLYWDTQRFQEAEAMYDRSLALIKKMAEKDSDFQLAYTNHVYRLSQLYPQIKNYNAAYRIGKEWIPILKKQSEEYPDLMLKDYAEGLGKQSFYAIFQAQYAESEQLAREGLQTDSTLHWIAANLASALLLQGKYKDAEKICRQYKDELKDTFLDNFSEFEQAGVIPKKREKDVEKIKKLLTQQDN